MKNYKKIILLTAIILLIALPVSAQIKPLIGKGGYVPCATDTSAVLNLDCFLDLLSGVSKLILGLTGSLALLYFVYGGIVLLTSGGVEARITNGKTILSHAIIGVIIIFGAYLLVVTIEKIVGVQYKDPTNSGLNKSIDPNKINTTPTAPTTQSDKFYCYQPVNAPPVSGSKELTKTWKMIATYNTEDECNKNCKEVDSACTTEIKVTIDIPSNCVKEEVLPPSQGGYTKWNIIKTYTSKDECQKNCIGEGNLKCL